MESCLGPVDIILAVVLPTPPAEGKKTVWEKSLGSTTTLSQSVLSSPHRQGNGVGYLGVCNNIWERVQKGAERLEVGKRGVDCARGKGLGSTGSAGGQIRAVLETGRGSKTEHKECTEVLRRKREPGEGYGVNGRAYRKRKGRGAHMCFSYVKW